LARQFLTPVQLPTGSASPASGVLGSLFYRSDLGQVVFYNGTEWVSLSTGAPADPVDGGSSSGYLSVADGGSSSTTEFEAVLDGGNGSSF
jgi:hypothetical protein